MAEFAYNAWYPAGWSRDISHELTRRRVLGRPVVLYRTSDGTVAALEDICPHRLAPLSIGRLKEDTIECGYHGMTFDRLGKCVKIPGQPRIPPSASVRSYPIVEKMGLAWIWMGDAALADTSKAYDLPQYHDPSWSAVEGDALRIDCNYISLAENLCDPAHVSFVHLSTLGRSGEDVPVQSGRQGNKIVTSRWTMDSPAIPLFQKFGHFKGNVDRWQYYLYTPPSSAVIDFDCALTGTGAAEGNRDNCIQIYSCHFITPVDEETCIDHWVFVKNFETDETTTRSMADQFRLAFDEDKVILEAIQRNEKEPRSSRPVRLAIDSGTVRMRKLIDETIAAESSSASHLTDASAA